MVQIMRGNMLRVFPQLENVKIDYGWAGPIDMTLNASPHFGRISPHIYFAQGYSGHGVALTGLAGRIIAEAILGNDGRLRIFEELKVPSFYGGKRLKKLSHQDRRTLLQIPRSLSLTQEKQKGVYQTRLYCFDNIKV